MAYFYIVLPGKPTPPVFGRLFVLTIYASLEAYFVFFRVPADLLKLVDGTLVYRVAQQYMKVFKFDALGSYIDLGSYGRQRFTTVDPTLTTAPVKSREDWLPVGNG